MYARTILLTPASICLTLLMVSCSPEPDDSTPNDTPVEAKDMAEERQPADMRQPAANASDDMKETGQRDMRGEDPVDPDPTPEPDMKRDVDTEDMKQIAAPGCGDGATLCDDFEGDAIPDHFREVNFGPSAIALDTTVSHSGSNSIKVTSSQFTQMLATPVPGPAFYGRVYLMSDTPMNPGHNTYINAGEGDGDPNHGEWIRIGEHREQLEINRKSDDAEILSSGDYNSLDGATQLAPNTWYCLEFLFDGPNKEVRVWVDGDPVMNLHTTEWGANYQTFKFGYERYHGPDKTLWYDDLALGTQRIGCL